MIAVDAMGGDFAPQVAVHGACNAARLGIPILLCGSEPDLVALLQSYDPRWQTLPITIKHCAQTIGMEEEPTRAVMHKKDSSLIQAVQAVADGTAHAIVSAGNSGAALVAGMFILGRIPGILRPAIGGFLPTQKSSVFCLDLGANTDCKPEYLQQFALMGSAYVQLVKGITHPRIALLSNGQERYKGSTAIKQTYTLLEQTVAIRFVGNVEPKELFDDYADVVVADGFVGNVMLKTVEGTARAIIQWLKAEYNSSFIKKSIGLLNAPVLSALKKKLDYAEKGGALLLGLNKPLIVAHGCSDAYAIQQAIKYAYTVVQQMVVEQFNERMRSLISSADTAYSTQQKSTLHHQM